MSKIVDGLTRFTERIVWGIVLVEVLFSDALSSTAFHGPNAFGHPRRIRRPPVGPAFALTFWGVFLITFLCGVANITMAAHFGTAWKMGVGALIGLLVYLTADSRDAGAGCWRESRNQIGFAPDS